MSRSTFASELIKMEAIVLKAFGISFKGLDEQDMGRLYVQAKFALTLDGVKFQG